MRRRKVHWRGIVGEITLVEIGAALDQEADCAMPVANGGQMQGRGLEQAASGQRIDQLRIGVEPVAKCCDVDGLRCGGDSLHLVLLGLRIKPAALDILRQDFDCGMRAMNSPAFPVG